MLTGGDGDGIPGSFKEIPPRHEPASFSVDQAVEKLRKFLAKD